MEHQTCRICNKAKPKTDDFFCVSNTNFSGFLYQCRSCVNARNSAKSLCCTTGQKIFQSKEAKSRRDISAIRHKSESGSTYDSDADIIERGLSLLSIDVGDWPVDINSIDDKSDEQWESLCDRALGVPPNEN
jgi:hypothetical protein